MHVENIKYIQTIMLAQSTTGFGKLMAGHYVLFWLDKDTNTFTAYEGKDPVKCYQSVAGKHPNYEFACMQSVPTSNVAIDLIRALRTANLTFPEIQKSLDTLRVARSNKSA